MCVTPVWIESIIFVMWLSFTLLSANKMKNLYNVSVTLMWACMGFAPYRMKEKKKRKK